jgi:vitamin B12 transporter
MDTRFAVLRISLLGFVAGAVSPLIVLRHCQAEVIPLASPISENVVVTATLSPERAPAVAASVTVITREEIEKSGKSDVLELLREVPGVDVVQSGGPGKVASVFLRGADSTQTLVLIDGVRVNSPYFSGYDFSSLSTSGVERIEIARGPFSALYGSDAIGGVVSVYTRPASKTPQASTSWSFGNRSFHEGLLFATAGTGDFAASLTARDARDGGERQTAGGSTVDHDSWRSREVSARLEWAPTEALQSGFRVERVFARTEVPSDGSLATPRRFTDFAQTLLTLPVGWNVSSENRLAAVLSQAELHPTFSDTDSFDPKSDTQTRTRAARIVDRWTLSGQTLAAAASFESSRVDSTDSFGPVLGGRKTETWGVALEDQIPLLESRLLAVAGVRYDHHSTFGASTNPRISLVYILSDRDSLRASFGTAFRAPSIGELYYPFYGNPDLSPERSRSYEVGYTRRSEPVELNVALFRNDVHGLIQPDGSTFLAVNVGRARTEGGEFSASAPIGSGLRGRISYTYLKAIDRTTGLGLLRRPRHRGSLDLAWTRPGWSADLAAVLVGRRPDIKAGTYPAERIEDPSYLRLDFFASYRLGSFSPFLRLENLADRRYSEADGFPAPRRRIAGGVRADF